MISKASALNRPRFDAKSAATASETTLSRATAASSNSVSAYAFAGVWASKAATNTTKAACTRGPAGDKPHCASSVSVSGVSVASVRRSCASGAVCGATGGSEPPRRTEKARARLENILLRSFRRETLRNKKLSK
jgi:hypothetical protein